MTEFLTAKAGYSHVWAGIPLAEAYVLEFLWNYGDGPDPVTADNVNLGLVARYEGISFEGGMFRTDIYDARVPLLPDAQALRKFDIQTQGYEIGVGYDWGEGFVRVKYADIDAEIDGKLANSRISAAAISPRRSARSSRFRSCTPLPNGD